MFYQCSAIVWPCCLTFVSLAGLLLLCASGTITQAACCLWVCGVLSRWSLHMASGPRPLAKTDCLDPCLLLPAVILVASFPIQILVITST